MFCRYKFRCVENFYEGRTITINVNQANNNTNTQQVKFQNLSKTEKTNSVFTEYDVFNGEIENTMQSLETGDCWLLSGVNSLNTTSWGKKIIKDALRPDGEGGAIVTLKGANSDKKEYRVTIADIDKALTSGKYSVGDDDMLAIEIAVEKYAKAQVAAGKLNKNPDDVLTGAIDRNILYLLSGSPTHDFHKNDKNIDKTLEKMASNPRKYAAYCGFKEDLENLYNNHAYSIAEIKKDKNGQKVVVLINPQDSTNGMTVPYSEFRENLNILFVLDDPKNPDKDLKSEIDELDEQIEVLKKQEENIK